MKKYQVFISSTYEDLKEERKEIIQALLEMDCIPTGMEMFQASDNSQWELIKSVIESCDYYIVIIAGRYESVHPITQKSYTQMEYEYASKIGIPIIAFLYENLDMLPNNKVENNKKNKRKLQQFIELTKNKMVRFWSDKHDLASVVSRSMYKMFQTHPRRGWVRNDSISYNDDNNIINSRIQKQELKSKESIIHNEITFWDKYNFYKECIKNPRYEFLSNYKIIIGDLHIDALKEIAHVILTAGIGSFADFFDFTLKPGYVTISFCSNLYEAKEIIQYDGNSYFSDFECIIPGSICITFYENIFKKIDKLYYEFKQYNVGIDEFLTLSLYEFGSTAVSHILAAFSEFISQGITVSNYGLNKKIQDIFSFEENEYYMICELFDDNNIGEKFIGAYFILNVKYIKILFDIFNIFV